MRHYRNEFLWASKDVDINAQMPLDKSKSKPTHKVLCFRTKVIPQMTAFFGSYWHNCFGNLTSHAVPAPERESVASRTHDENTQSFGQGVLSGRLID